MPHWRADYRSAARAALSAHPRFTGVSVMPAWRGSIDADSLPVVGVVTPDERITLPARDQTERTTLLQVVLKRQGGDDLEDELDLDADAIEAALAAALPPNTLQCLPDGLSIMIEDRADMAIGTVIVTFRVASWRPFPAT